MNTLLIVLQQRSYNSLDYWLDTCNQGRIGNYEMEGRWSEKTISRHPCFAH